MTATDPSDGKPSIDSNVQRSADDETHSMEGFYGIYECQTCPRIALVVRNLSEPLSCHDEPMNPVHSGEISVRPPKLESVLLEAFGLPKPGIDVCMCVIGEGAASTSRVAAPLGYERSTITRYLNQLVDIGLLERHERNRQQGGVVNVYTGLGMERVKRETLVGFLRWAGHAATLIESANRQKEERMAGDDLGNRSRVEGVFWDE